MFDGDNANQINSNKAGPRAPESFDVQKSGWRYRLKQKIKWMTPKKKIMYFVLPVLVLAVLAVFLWVVAAPGDPVMRLVDKDNQSIDDIRLNCGETYQIKIFTDVDPSTHSNQDMGVIAAGAFIDYDPAVFSTVTINNTGSAYRSGGAGLEFVDSANNLIQVVRASVNLTAAIPIVSDNQLLAILNMTVASGATGSTELRFYGTRKTGSNADPQELWSSFGMEDGSLSDIDYDGSSGEYAINIDCTAPSQCLSPNVMCPVGECIGTLREPPSGCCEGTCETAPACPAPNVICQADQWCDGSWHDQSILCCNGRCKDIPASAVTFWLKPPRVTVNVGDEISAVLSISTSNDMIEEAYIALEYDTTALGLDNSDISYSPTIGKQEVVGQTIKISNFSDPLIGNDVYLATLKFKAKKEGVTEVTLDMDNTKAGPIGEPTVQIINEVDSQYTINQLKVRLTGELSIVPTENSVAFAWTTEPAAQCTVQIVGENPLDPDNTLTQGPDGLTKLHRFTFLNINGTYEYKINCSATGNYLALDEITGSFSTQVSTGLEIYDRTIPDNKITANSAVVSWWTRGGENGDGKADSAVYYREHREHGGSFSASKRFLIDKPMAGHTIRLIGLANDQEYDLIISSLISGSGSRDSQGSCNGGNSSGCVSSQIILNAFKTKTAVSSKDSNIVLKVNQNRVCDKWLYCNAYVQLPRQNTNSLQIDQQTGNQEICFSSGLCDQLGAGGQCLHSVDMSAKELVSKHPDEVEAIKNLSGYSKVGLDWGWRCTSDGSACTGASADCGDGYRCVEASTGGYYPYSIMHEIGSPITVANSNFEEGTIRPWKAYNQGNKKTNINNVIDVKNRANRVLQIDVHPDYDFSGARINGLTNKVEAGKPYIISFRARTDNADGQKILVELVADEDKPVQYTLFSYYDFENNIATTTVRLQPYWQEYIMKVEGPPNYNNKLNVAFVRAEIDLSEGGLIEREKAFFLDDISMKGVLAVGENLSYVSRSCRLYAKENAPACDYYDEESGKDYKGWKGYCVETDPGWPDSAQPMCLQWWPVDVIRGESNVFGADDVAGYQGRKPLYYCLEAAGNYQRKKLPGLEHYFKSSEYKVESSFTSLRSKQYRDENSNASCVDTDVKVDWSRGNDWGGWTISNSDNYWSMIFQEMRAIKWYEIAGVRMKFSLWDDPDSNTCTSPHGDGRVSETARNMYAVADGYVGWWIERGNISGYDETIPADDMFNFLYNDAECQTRDGNSEIYTVVKFEYDNEDLLSNIKWRVCDTSKGGIEFNYVPTFYLREPCLKIAQVVTMDGENVAWVNRINGGNINDDNWLGYGKSQDSEPFGSVVPPAPIWDPPNWKTNEQPLFIEPADTSEFTQGLGQARAGSPYGIPLEVVNEKYQCINSFRMGLDCTNNPDACNVPSVCHEEDPSSELWCSYGVCSPGGNECGSNGECVHFGDAVADGWSCANKSDLCVSEGESCVYQSGRCELSSTGSYSAYGRFGPPICVSGPNMGQECSNNGNRDCGLDYESGEYGMCVGFKKPDGIENWEKFNELIMSAKPEDHLAKIFAKSYGVWEWGFDGVDKKFRYIKVDEDKDGVMDNFDKTKSGIPPQVKNMWVNEKNKDDKGYPIVIIAEGMATLKFDSIVDSNQVPLVRYTVDWDDGNQSTEAGLRIAGRDANNPHILVHYYKYSLSCDTGIKADRSASGICEFKPKVELEDNWGMTNSNKPPNSFYGQEFSGVIRVCENRSVCGGMP